MISAESDHWAFSAAVEGVRKPVIEAVFSSPSEIMFLVPFWLNVQSSGSLPFSKIRTTSAVPSESRVTVFPFPVSSFVWSALVIHAPLSSCAVVASPEALRRTCTSRISAPSLLPSRVTESVNGH